MNIMYMGTPEFAVYPLDEMIKNGYNVSAVISQPDRARGRRGMKLMPTPVKQFALDKNIDVYTPESIKGGELAPVLEKYKPDMIIVTAYGKILPEYILKFPSCGCVNIHASLLPELRGAAPIQWSIMNGKSVTGITTMYMEKGLDTGDMIYKTEVSIDIDDNYNTLHDKLAKASAPLIIKTIRDIEKGIAPRVKQDDTKSTYASMITKEMFCIDFNKPAADVHNKIRGLFPKAFTLLNGQTFKILCSNIGDIINGNPGEIVKTDMKNGIFVSCGDGRSLNVTEIQTPAGKKMTVADYMRGHEIKVGTVLGK